MRHLWWMVMFIIIGALNWHSAYIAGAFRHPAWFTLLGLGLCIGCAWDCLWAWAREKWPPNER